VSATPEEAGQPGKEAGRGATLEGGAVGELVGDIVPGRGKPHQQEDNRNQAEDEAKA
jgi:hypothetical protein